MSKLIVHFPISITKFDNEIMPHDQFLLNLIELLDTINQEIEIMTCSYMKTQQDIKDT